MTSSDSKPKVFFIVVILVSILGVGYIAYRQVVNDKHCRQLYGTGSTWAGRDECSVLKDFNKEQPHER